MPFIENIIVYPIKALDGVRVNRARITAGGALERDREFAMVDDYGNFVNGKRHARIHQVRAQFDESIENVELHLLDANQRCNFHLVRDATKLEACFSDFFGFPISIKQNIENGFPDDTKASGPTLISAATLEEVSGWFPGLSPQDILRRFRVNVVIGGVPAFWEDHLFGEPETTVDFEIGAVQVKGINPCKRCVVPSRDPLTGEAMRGFQRTLAERRKETLSDWVVSSRFDHYYRLTVNTRIPLSEQGKVIRIDDVIRMTLPPSSQKR
ncbi:MAG: uncharacterized protein QOH70_2110 [Blastocatellia bacterium]|jgi:uncharacterized protein YcbX|nr:uncharacterized protein [Blastocatellia bacterium]